MKPQRFAVTPGEPAGIGPDLCLLLASHPQPHPLIAITSRDLLLERAAQLGVAVTLLDVGPVACMCGTPRWQPRWLPGD